MDWTPCEDETPKKNGKYIVTVTSPYIGEVVELAYFAKDLYEIDAFDFADKKGVSGWYRYDGEFGYFEVTDVIAWQPVPKEYKRKKNV